MNNEMSYISYIPFFAVLVSLSAVPLILISGKRPNLREAWTLIAAFVKFALVISLVPAALQGYSAEINLLEISTGINLALKADQPQICVYLPPFIP